MCCRELRRSTVQKCTGKSIVDGLAWSLAVKCCCETYEFEQRGGTTTALRKTLSIGTKAREITVVERIFSLLFFIYCKEVAENSSARRGLGLFGINCVNNIFFNKSLNKNYKWTRIRISDEFF